jgi:hypothetical protein
MIKSKSKSKTKASRKDNTLLNLELLAQDRRVCGDARAPRLNYFGLVPKQQSLRVSAKIK